MIRHAILLASALALVPMMVWAQTASEPAPAGFPTGTPEEAGFDPVRLSRIGDALNREIAAGRMPGAVVAIARDNKLVFLQAYGYRDKAAGVRMTTDTIFNIASMTKPMTTVTALTLIEQGLLGLDEPVSAYLPEHFTAMKVATLNESGDAVASTAPASRAITLRDLMTHTSGLVYGGRGTTAVHRMYPGGSATAALALTGPQFLDTLSSLPLLNQPGATWDYGFGLDVTGLIVEATEKRSLGEAMDAAIWRKLGMVDTGFTVPADKAARYARALPTDPETGKRQTVDPDATRPTKFECGGGCLVSTATDYLRFASMLLNDGTFSGQRVLSPVMAHYMVTNQLSPQTRNLIGNADPTRAGYGFGLGLAVRTSTAGTRLIGSDGDFSWPGASGTDWWVDPARKLVVVFMAHTPGPARWHYRYLINTLVYQALAN
ncbi:MAG: serine hydrolase domain-containing protein [Janthinobacterium lividum]